MRARCSPIAIAALVAGCAAERPDLRVICHNSNCAEPQDPAHDDTIDALARSLALRDDDGRPVIDGVEMDVVVVDGRCAFAHDATQAMHAPTITDAAGIVADYLRTADAITHDGAPFVLELEIKPPPAGMLDAAVDCAVAAAMVVRDAASESGIELVTSFEAYAPATLRAFDGRRPPGSKLVLGVGLPKPLLDDTHPLSELDGLVLDGAEIHPGWITDTELRALRSMKLELGAWFLDITTETLAGIDRIGPSCLLTGQARTARAWLGD